MAFDSSTFNLVFACVTIVSSIMLLVEWHRTRQESIRFWAMGFLTITLVVLLRVFCETGDAMIETTIPALRSLTFCLLAQGSLLFSGRRPIPTLYLLPGLWFALVLMRWDAMAADESSPEQATYMLVAQVMPCLITALAFARFQRDTFTGVSVALIFGVHAVFLIWRGFHLGAARIMPVSTTGDPIMILVATESLVFFSLAAHLLVGAAKDAVAVRWKTVAEIDALTGLLGRSAFLKVCEGRIRAGRLGALAMVDLDHFKSVNDEFGHGVGDEALRVFARIVSASLGERGIVGRLGGEEFAILIDGEPAEASTLMSEALRMFTQGSGALLPRPLTASAGVVALRQEAGVEALLLQADHALYKAKAGGRNRVVEVLRMDGPTLLPSARTSAA